MEKCFLFLNFTFLGIKLNIFLLLLLLWFVLCAFFVFLMSRALVINTIDKVQWNIIITI